MTPTISHQDFEHRLREAELFIRINTAAADLSPLAVLNAVCREVAVALGVPAAGFGQIDADRGGLTVIAEYRSVGASALGVRLSGSNPLTSAVLEGRRAVVVNRVADDPRLGDSRDQLLALGVHSLMVVPVVAHGEVIGTLGLDTFEPHEFSEADQRLATSVMRAVAPVLEQTRLFEQLRATLGRYEALVESLDGAVWEAIWDGQELIYTFVSPQIEAMLGYPQGAFLGNRQDSIWKDVLHVPDRASTRDARLRALESLQNGGVGRSTVHSRALHRDGHVVWLRDQISAWVQGGQVYLRGLILDITEQQRSAELERDRNAVLELIAQGRPLEVTLERLRLMAATQAGGVGSAVILFDEAEFAVVNVVGMPRASVERLQSPEGQQFLLEFAPEKQVLKTGQVLRLAWDDPRFGVYSREALGIDKQHITALPVRSSHGDLLATMLVLHQEPELELNLGLRAVMDLLVIAVEHHRLMRTLEFQALHDPLTRLPNRKRYEERLALALETQAVVGLLSVDLNGFKAVNDRYGHSVGDELLAGIAEVLRRSVSAADTVARLGGDEFVVVLPGADSRDRAARLAARIRDNINGFRLESGASVTASVGVALYPEDATEASALYRAADQAMYLEKHRA